MQLRRIARRAARYAREQGGIFFLEGPMGAGKTTFTRLFCRALGIQEGVSSPTFQLVHVYSGKVPVYHLDLYRLESLQAVLELDVLAKLESPGAIALIEWPETVALLQGDRAIRIQFERNLGDPRTRTLRIDPRI